MRILKDGKVILEDVEVVKSKWKKVKGLMFRKGLPEKSGMLFVSDEESRPGFWMLGMRFPIDMIFLNEDMRVIDVIKNVQPMKPHPNSWGVHSPKEPAKYVLEVNAGFVEKNKIKKGEFLEMVHPR